MGSGGYTNFNMSSGSNLGFGQSFDQYYDLYRQQQPSIQKGLGMGRLTDMGGGMFRVNDRGYQQYGIGRRPSNVVTQGSLEGVFGQNRGRAQLGAALMADYQNTIAAGEQHSANVNRALGGMQAAFGQGAQNIRQSGLDAYADLTGRADQIMGQGQQFFADQSQFNKDVLAESDRLFKQSIDNFEKSYSADTSSALLGMAKQRGAERNALMAEAKNGNPQAQDALARMDFETMQTTQSAMTTAFSQFNQARSGMEMARAQNYGAVGMQAASNINQAGGVMASFTDMSKSMYEQGVAMKQGAEALANQFYATGMTEVADRIISNPGSPVSMAAVLGAMFSFDMTPGTENLTGMPGAYFGEMA